MSQQNKKNIHVQPNGISTFYAQVAIIICGEITDEESFKLHHSLIIHPIKDSVVILL